MPSRKPAGTQRSLPFALSRIIENSSSVAPSTSGLSAPMPAAIASIVGCGMSSPSITGPSVSPFSMKPRSRSMGLPPGAGSVSCFCSSRTRSSLSVDSPARVGSTPPSAASLRPNYSASVERDVGGRARDAVDARDERLRARHAEQRQHRAAAGRLPGDRDPRRIAAERRDVVAHPLEGEQPVEHAAVHRGVLDPAEAVEAEAVRDRDGDDAVAVERGAVVPGARGGAREVAAAVDVDEHRQRGIRRRSRREDVHVQGRIARNRRLGDEGHAGVAALRGRRRRRWRRGRPPTGRAARGRRSGGRRRAARRRGCRGRRQRRCPRHPLATDRGRGRRWCRPRRGSRFR